MGSHVNEDKKKILKNWKMRFFSKTQKNVWAYDRGEATTEMWEKSVK